MAAGNQVDVNIKLTADTKGGAEAEKSVKGVGKAAKESETTGKSAASGLKSAYEGFGNTVRNVGKVVGSFTKALGLIGFAVSAIQTVIEAFQKLQEWIHRDEIAAAKLREEMEKKAYAESVALVARNYELLNQKVDENLRLEQQKNQLIDERTRMERNSEDAQLRLYKANEIKALDPNDPDYHAWEAQNNLDLFNMNHQGRRLSRGDQAEQQRLTEAVQKETEEAQNASVELQRTLSQLSGVLQGFTQQMKQVQREVDAAQKRTNAAQAESPSGN